MTLEPASDVARCPQCGWTEIARREPLFVVTGASGSGKSAVFAPLALALPECAVFDADWLIDPLSRTHPVDWQAFRDAWLSVAHGVAQARRSTVLLGTFMPEQLEQLPARRWMGPIHFAVLDCTDESRTARLQARPPWREHAIDEHLAFAAHLRRTIEVVIDTTTGTPQQVADQIAAWVRLTTGGGACGEFGKRRY